MSWRQAIVKVLKDSGKPLHYAEIAQRIIDRGYRKSVGATPASSVAATVALSLRNDGDGSPFFKPAMGIYGLRSVTPAAVTVEESDEAVHDAEEMGLINAFGMFWRRDEVNWKTANPLLMGVQQAGSQEVDFSRQIGVYLLQDGDRVIYVGRVTEPRLGSRLSDHNRDRLSGRWDRFSWFGVLRVEANGKLSKEPEQFTLQNLVSTMEAILIEGLEPPQNRRQGDGFNALEFLQGVDPAIREEKEKSIINQILARAKA